MLFPIKARTLRCNKKYIGYENAKANVDFSKALHH